MNGYRWWYVDALSDDGKDALTIIGFVGSVFSPYYAKARKYGPADPTNYCALNVALYGKKTRWAMTERGRRDLFRTEESFGVGASSMEWRSDGLQINIDETCSPLPFRLRGSVRLVTENLYDEPVQLDADGKHFWRAVSVGTRVEVSFDRPKLKWSGIAYHDMNWGEEPLEDAFTSWSWLRAETSNGTIILYDVMSRDGERRAFGRRFQDGHVSESKLPKQHMLAKGFWRMTRPVLSEAAPTLLQRFEDAPFYTRSHVKLTLDGKVCSAVHESLSLERFANPIVQRMLPFRMPRRD